MTRPSSEKAGISVVAAKPPSDRLQKSGHDPGASVTPPATVPTWGPALPVTPRTAFLSVRGLA